MQQSLNIQILPQRNFYFHFFWYLQLKNTITCSLLVLKTKITIQQEM